MAKFSLKGLLDNAMPFFRRNAPGVLTGIAVGSAVIAVVSAITATPVALQRMQEAEEKKGDALTVVEKAKAAVPCYIPTAMWLGMSVGSTLSSNHIHNKRHAALASAYMISTEALKDFTDKAKEVVGTKKVQEIKDEVSKEQLKRNQPEKTDIIVTGRGNTLCFDAYNGRSFYGDIEKIRKAVVNINAQLVDEGYASLNDLYYELGLKGTDFGEASGWQYKSRSSLVSFRPSAQLTDDDMPCLIMQLDPPPQYGFDRFG